MPSTAHVHAKGGWGVIRLGAIYVLYILGLRISCQVRSRPLGLLLPVLDSLPAPRFQSLQPLFVQWCLQQLKQILSDEADALAAKLAQMRALGAAARQLAAVTRASLHTQAVARAEAIKVQAEQIPSCTLDARDLCVS